MNVNIPSELFPFFELSAGNGAADHLIPQDVIFSYISYRIPKESLWDPNFAGLGSVLWKPWMRANSTASYESPGGKPVESLEARKRMEVQGGQIIHR